MLTTFFLLTLLSIRDSGAYVYDAIWKEKTIDHATTKLLVTTIPVTTATVPEINAPVATISVTILPEINAPETYAPATSGPAATVTMTTEPIATIQVATNAPLTTIPVITVPEIIVPESNEPATNGPGTNTGALWTQGKNVDCYTGCGHNGGSCTAVCGPGGYCCKKGSYDCPIGAREVAHANFHSCVIRNGVNPVTTNPVTTLPETEVIVTDVPATMVPVTDGLATATQPSPSSSMPASSPFGASSGATPNPSNNIEITATSSVPTSSQIFGPTIKIPEKPLEEVTTDKTPTVSKDTCVVNMDCCKMLEDTIATLKVTSKEECTTIEDEVCNNIIDTKIIITHKKHCKNITKEECHTKSKEICKTIYEEKCEDEGRIEYKEECNIVVNRECQNTTKIKYEEECYTEYEEKCKGYGHGCEQVPKKICKKIPVPEPYTSCHDAPKKECKSVPNHIKENKCHNVSKEKCSFVPDTKCVKKYEEKCRHLPESLPVVTPIKKCHKVPRKECKIVESSEPLYHKNAKKVCQTCKTATFVKSSIVYDMSIKQICTQLKETKCKIKLETIVIPENTTQCKTSNVCKTTYNTEYKNECKSIYKNICEEKEKTEYKENCIKSQSEYLNYPQQNCKKVPHKVSYKICKNVPKQECKQISVQVPSEKCKPVQECKSFPGAKTIQKVKDNCYDVPVTKCTPVTIDIPRRVYKKENKKYCAGEFIPQPASKYT